MRYLPALTDSPILETDSGAVGEEGLLIEKLYEETITHYLKPFSIRWANPVFRFNTLKEKWASDTALLSSITEISMHPSYQQIIGMGPIAIQFILFEMTKEPGHWFWALKAITGEDPVRPDHRGDILKMTEAWLEWGAGQKYIP